MNYNFDTFPNRRTTESLKWNAYDEDVLPMWVADMDFISPEPVAHALQARTAHGIYGYPGGVAPSSDPSKDLPGLVQEWVAARYGWQVELDDLVFLPGVVTGFNLACHMVAEPGGNVLVQTPVYPPFLRAAGYAGMQRQDAYLCQGPDGSYEIDWDSFENAITDKTKLFILCNPHNPVGRVFRQDELERMAEICLRRQIPICSDEIHADLIFNGRRHIPIASLDPAIAQSSITLIAPSKTFNIAGLQCSIAIIPNPELRKRYHASGKGLVEWVNVMGWTAAKAAYAEGHEWLEQVLVYLEANRDALFQFVQREMPGVQMAKPEGTYLAWLDCRRSGVEGSSYKFFLERARVALNDGETFGPGGKGFVRLNFGCPRSMMMEALCRMRDALIAVQ